MRLTVITPLAAESACWLPDAAASIAACRDAAGEVELEWIVCRDGSPPPPADVQPDRIVGWQSRRGVAAARNAALAAATGEWVIPLDADDQLDPAGLPEIITALHRASPNLGWLAANRLLLDGSRTPHWQDHPRDYVAGELATCWTSPFPFHPNSVVFHREALLCAGGWPALGSNEDLAAVLLLAEDTPGRAETAVLTHYRTWAEQLVAAPGYPLDKTTAFTTIAGLLNARRRHYGRPPAQPPQPGPAHGRIRTGGPRNGSQRLPADQVSPSDT